ncbi:MAG: hypothetical protein U0326_31805 [Polyangiales bacterium]
MKTRRQAALLVIFALGTVSSLAWAHSTGHESRTVAQCGRLPTPERQQCLQCVTRAIRHHYHPDYPPGARCRPDNGRP